MLVPVVVVLLSFIFASSLFWDGMWAAAEGKTKITFRYRSLLNGFWVGFASFIGFGFGFGLSGVDCDVRYSNIDRQYFCATRGKA